MPVCKAVKVPLQGSETIAHPACFGRTDHGHVDGLQKNSAEATLHWGDYEMIDWERVVSGELRASSYCVRKVSRQITRTDRAGHGAPVGSDFFCRGGAVSSWAGEDRGWRVNRG